MFCITYLNWQQASCQHKSLFTNGKYVTKMIDIG
jgi:hypothetical protein